MARLRSDAKAGFYPVPPEVISLIADRVIPAERGECIICDPCAGNGDAIIQLADILDAVPFAVEISEDRAATLNDKLGELALAPCDYLTAAISPNSFSLMFVNPPYSDKLGGGGRVEFDFIKRAIPQLAHHGVLVLACPERILQQHTFWSMMSEQFLEETICGFPFPEAVRKYNEVIVMAQKRDKPGRDQYTGYWSLASKIFNREPREFELPPGKLPVRFKKTCLSPKEMDRALAKSPLRRMFAVPPEMPLPRPPLAPGEGHRALLLASGLIDGLVEPEGEEPHVVRGTCRKTKYLSESSTTVNDDGSTTEKTVYAEKINLVIRALDQEGIIHELMEG